MSSTANPTQENTNLTQEDEAFLFAMELGSASVLPMVLKSAIELDLLELIKKAGPGSFVSTTELAAQVSTTNPEAHVMLDRMLRLLASHSVLDCKLATSSDGTVERVYGLTAVCKFLMKNKDGVSMAPFLLMNQDKVAMESWYHLKDAIVEGGVPFHKAHGMATFEYIGTNPKFNKIFNVAMSDHSTMVMKKILETYKGFEGLNSIVDVGGGIGTSLNMIISEYPSIKGINFDLPHVFREGAPSYPGVEHVGGDMFTSIPKGDAIFLKWISHIVNDEACLKLYKICCEALPENGKLIVCESIVPEIPDTQPTTRNVLHLDAIMLTANNGGRERTEREFHALAKAAGFKEFHKVCCAYNTWVMELLK